MITLTDAAADALAGSWTMHLRVESWLGDTLLSDDVPVTAGAEEVDRTLTVPERVTLTVPREMDAASWDPLTADAPLATFGQRIRVLLGIELANGVIEWVPRGWFTVQTSDTRGDSVEVSCVGLLGLVEEARFVAPYQPSGTLASTLRGLVEPALTVDIDTALTDRAVPAAMAWDEDRLAAVHELVDAWPADARVTEDGHLYVGPAGDDADNPVLDLTDGEGGTVLQWSGAVTRDEAFTVAVARGQASDGGVVQGVAYDTDPDSPLRITSDFNPLPVPFFYFSPLLTTVAQCQAAARTVLDRKRRTSSRQLTAETVPHPALQVGDVVSVTGAGLTAQPCSVEALTLPYTAAQGPMSLRLRVLS